MDYRWKIVAILVPVAFALYTAAQVLTALISLVDGA